MKKLVCLGRILRAIFFMCFAFGLVAKSLKLKEAIVRFIPLCSVTCSKSCVENDDWCWFQIVFCLFVLNVFTVYV